MIPAESRETLLDLIDEITVTLEELQASERKGTLCPYGEGSKAAYVHVLEFIQQRYDEAKAECDAKQLELAQFVDANRNVISAKAQIQEEKLLNISNIHRFF